jgi:membrane fusion protein, epimerase transport system
MNQKRLEPAGPESEPWSSGAPGTARLLRSGLLCVALLAAGVWAWTGLAPLSAAVVAQGHVKVDLDRKVVQHQEGGIIAEVLVRDGSLVRAGETLLVLADTRVDAELESLRNQLDAERARRARFAAEERSSELLSFPPDLVQRAAAPALAELLERERGLFEARRQALTGEISLLGDQVAQIDLEISARHAQARADEAAHTSLLEELSVHRSLAERGFVSRLRVASLERGLAESEARQAGHRAELARAGQRATELRARATALRNQFVRDASTGHAQSSSRVLELSERLRAAADAGARQRIVAPVDGEVVAMRGVAAGSVLAPRERILEIVPSGAELVVEARMKPEDVVHVPRDAEADVRLVGLPHRTSGSIDGRVRYVSADRLVDANNGTAYYLVQVSVSAESLQRAGRTSLQAGMPVEVYVRTQPRTAFNYLFDPLTAFAARSLREH